MVGGGSNSWGTGTEGKFLSWFSTVEFWRKSKRSRTKQPGWSTTCFHVFIKMFFTFKFFVTIKAWVTFKFNFQFFIIVFRGLTTFLACKVIALNLYIFLDGVFFLCLTWSMKYMKTSNMNPMGSQRIKLLVTFITIELKGLRLSF